MSAWRRLYSWIMSRVTFGMYVPPVAPPLSPQESIRGIEKVLELLEQAEDTKEHRSNEELAKARSLDRAGNRRAARAALKRHRFYQGQLDTLSGMKSRLEDQKFKLENMRLGVAIYKTMEEMGVSIKQLQVDITPEKIDGLMDDIQENMNAADDVTEAISKPMRDAGGLSDADLDEELDRLRQQDVQNAHIDPLKMALAAGDIQYMPFVAAPTRPSTLVAASAAAAAESFAEFPEPGPAPVFVPRMPDVPTHKLPNPEAVDALK